MFVLYDKENQRLPIKVWLKNKEDIEEGCLEQAINLSNLPFTYKWISLMPDTHQGYGMPIGGVIATEGVIIPNAVGVDIGCGMSFIETNIHRSEFKQNVLSNLVGQIMRNIPVGFNHYKEKQRCKTLDSIKNNNLFIDKLVPEIENGYYQIGTLGGGNHFIELQEDENGMVCIMLHSGSRNFGYKIAKYFYNIAKELNNKWYSIVPEKWELAFLPVDTDEGKEYIKWMNLALNFAKENRQKMMKIVKQEMIKKLPNIEFKNEIDIHHNYAAIENHFGKNVWVHRKGATRARKGDIGIIPGSMGSYSYIVEGLGNSESFCSCSHGAGRALSRNKALEKYSTQKVIEDLKKQNIILGKKNKEKVADECRWAYKDIDVVIENEKDLVKPIKKLKTIAVVKG